MSERPQRVAADTGTVDADNPWPGLAAFREADQIYFQGREAVVGELTRLVMRLQLTVLHGVSGLGKTSVLQAGLFPRLREEHLLPVYVRLSHAEDSPEPVDQVWQAIERAAADAEIEAPAVPKGCTLWEYFHRKDAKFWDARNRIVTPLLVFDQFEELFTLGQTTPERRHRTETFLTEVSDLVEGHPAPEVRARLELNPEEALGFSMTDQPCKVLLSLREDFLPDLAELRGQMPTITNGMYRLQPMTTAEALRVVEVGGRLVDRDVAEQIVAFVASARSAPGTQGEAAVVEPALLSVFCRELNNTRRLQGRERITADLLEGSGTSIIADFYARTITEGGLSDAVRIFVEERLLTESGYRDSVAEEQALRTPGITRSDIDTLILRRLLRREDAGAQGRSRLELTHDVLADAVRASRDRRRLREQEALASAERRTAEARARKEAEETAAREQQRREFEAAQELAATQQQAAELAVALAREEQRAREAAERLAALERRARRRQIALLSVLLVVAGVLALLAWREADRAHEAEIATSRALSMADVDRVARGEPWALAFLARAIRKDPDSALARGLLFDTLARQVLPVAQMPHGEPLARATLNAGGTRVLTVAATGTARLWDARTGDAVSAGPGVGLSAGDGAITIAEFSPDGTLVVTASDTGTTQVWDAATARPIGEPLPSGAAVTASTFAPDNAHLVIASDDGRAVVWALDDGTATEVRAEAAPIVQADFDPTGAYVLTVSADGSAAVWDVQAGAEVARVGNGQNGAAAVIQAAFSHDGQRIVAVLVDGSARLFTSREGRPVGAPVREAGPIVWAAFDPTGRRVITTSLSQDAENGRSVTVSRLWDTGTGTPLGSPLTHDGWMSTVAFSHDGSAIVTASRDRTAQVWDARTGAPQGPRLEHARAVIWAGFSPDGRRVLTASDDGTAQIWDAQTGAPRGAALRHEGPLVSAGFSDDGAVVLTASADGAARLWDARTGVTVPTRLHQGGGFLIERAVFSADGTHVVTSGTLDPNLPDAARGARQDEAHRAQIWAVDTGEQVGTPLAHAGLLTAIDVSRSGPPRLVTAAEDGTARLWDGRSGAALGAAMTHAEPVRSAVFSRDGSRVVTASADQTARVWDGTTGAAISAPLTHPVPVHSATFTPDGTQVFTGAADGTARLWDVATGEVLAVFEGLETPVVSVALSPDGARLLTSSDAQSLVWDVASRQPIGPRLPHAGALAPPMFSPNGASLVTTSPVDGAGIWDVRVTPELRWELRREDAVLAAAFTGDGRLVTASQDGTARIWSVRTRDQVGAPMPHGSEVRRVVFSRDASRILTIAADGVARLWDAPVGSADDAALLVELAETVGGREVDEVGGVRAVADHGARLSALRARASEPGAGASDTHADAFLGWLFADPTSRTVSPLSRLSVPTYISRLLAEGETGHREAGRLFPAHPALRASQGAAASAGRAALTPPTPQ